MKIFFRNIHLYLSLAAGIIFFVECVTGSILVFEEEIRHMLSPQVYYANSVKDEVLPVENLIRNLQKTNPKAQVTGIKVYHDPMRVAELNFITKKADKPGEQAGRESRKVQGAGRSGQQPGMNRERQGGAAIAGKDGQRPGRGGRGARDGKVALVNPYTGEIQAVKESAQEDDFFTITLQLHQSLLAGPTGKTILGISTFVVLTILITGVILWWPKTKKMIKSRLTIKWDSGWKRLNHDLHLVLGIYCTFFLIIFLVTSLPWSFQWANQALYTMTGSKQANMRPSFASQDPNGEDKINLDKALAIGQKEFAVADYWNISLPRDPEGIISVTIPSNDPLHRNGFDNVYLDQYSGEILGKNLHKDMPGGWHIRRYMKPIHTGSIGGIPTKSLAFIVCLLSATFPITGVILWLNRLRKKKPSGRKRRRTGSRYSEATLREV